MVLFGKRSILIEEEATFKQNKSMKELCRGDKRRGGKEREERGEHPKTFAVLRMHIPRKDFLLFKKAFIHLISNKIL